MCVCVCGGVWARVGVCVYLGGLGGGGGGFFIISAMWHMGDKLCLHFFFYITLLVVHSKSVSSHLYRYVQLLTGHEFLIAAGKW